MNGISTIISSHNRFQRITDPCRPPTYRNSRWWISQCMATAAKLIRNATYSAECSPRNCSTPALPCTPPVGVGSSSASSVMAMAMTASEK